MEPAAPPGATPASPAQASASVVAGWRQALAAWLAHHKSYPEEARRRSDEGTVAVRFSLDRSGRVVDVTVLRGSGSAILDAATVAMLRNAVLPPPPAMSADQVTISVQVHYALAD
jgi:periplasmic protein TonB